MPLVKTIRPYKLLWFAFFSLFCTLSLSSCSRILIGTIVEPTLGNLRQQSDIELVCEGGPSYLLLLDSMIGSNPDDPDLLKNGSQAYGSFIAAQKSCGKPLARIRKTAEKAHHYGLRLLEKTIGLSLLPAGEPLQRALERMNRDDVPNLFWSSWALLAWVQAEQGSPESVAALVSLEAVMQRVLELDESYEHGLVHLFFGTLYGAKPVILGGNPELARHHFERGLELSQRKVLVFQTTYAETVARNTMDRTLHDQLLQEVLDFDLDSAPENGLLNRIARRKARELLAEDFFGD